MIRFVLLQGRRVRMVLVELHMMAYHSLHMMEREPKSERKIFNYEDALTMARADGAGWQDAQVWTLEDYLVRRTGEQLNGESRDKFNERLRDLGDYTIENLTALGDEYNLMADFDLEAESLMVYCRRNGMELSP
jgi:hypothetical protein